LSVCAVVVGGDAKAVAALEAQTVPPEELLVAGDLHEAMRVGAGQYPDWVWALDASVTAAADALERLLAVTRPAALLAGKVVTPGGELDPGSLPFARVRDPDSVVAAFEQRLLPIRVARSGSLLVRREVIERQGPPRPRRRDDLPWTARLLRGEPGYLVPGSVAVREHERRASAAGLLELALGPGLSARERPWYALRAFDALRGASS
jgi:hypothetical protein